MATSASTSRGKYRVASVKLSEAAAAAAKLLSLYSYVDGDGQIILSPEPVAPLSDNPATFLLEVTQAWEALRSALVASGQIAGESQPLPLGTGEAVFLRVEYQTAHSSGGMQWVRHALFEVLRGVGSYAYADGAALDLFYMHEKEKAVRVVREVMPESARVAYLGGDRTGVTLSEVVGVHEPGELDPALLATGWAVVSDLSNDPEPDFSGLLEAAVVLPVPGPQGLPGQRGEKGDRGETGAPGTNGRDGVSVTNIQLHATGEPGVYEFAVYYSNGETLSGGGFVVPGVA